MRCTGECRDVHQVHLSRDPFFSSAPQRKRDSLGGYNPRMKSPTTIAGRIRLAAAGLALLAGGSAGLIGAGLTIFAMVTGRHDPRHAGAMVLAGSVPLLIAGVVLLAVAFLLWPRTSHPPSDRQPAA